MKTTNHFNIFLASCWALSSLPSLAYEYKQGAIHTKIENDISMGIGWSVSNPNPAFIGVGNGGTASTLSSDDHRLNFDKGDIYTQIIKGLHTLSFEYDDIGVFVRGKWWYDFEQQDHHHNLYDFNNQGRYRYAKGAGIELLDAYAFSRWKVNELDGEVRIGRQVINWGNDDYTHARNDLYAYDGNAYRRPGMILAEALIPAPTIYVSQKLNANTSIDLYYQYGWEKMAVSQCGTFFSTTDVIADGCTQGNLIYGSDFRPHDSDYLYIPRQADKIPHDGGEYGIALHYTPPSIKNTEFGLFATQYHSRAPFYSVIGSKTFDLNHPDFDPNLVGNAPMAAYLADYPDKIRLYAATFETTLAEGATKFSGEFSFRPNMPLQINSTDLTYTALGIDSLAQKMIGTALSPTVIQNPDTLQEASYIQGYRRHPVSQIQLAINQFLPGTLGADWFLLMGEVAWNHIGELKTGVGKIRYGRDSIYGYGAVAAPDLCESLLNTENPQYCNQQGFYSKNSWGYRTALIANFPNIGHNISLRPMLVWSHDVSGWGPNFNEQAKSIELSLTARYQNRYSATLKAKNYFSGRYNTWTDRDFISLSLGLNF